jgi:hypothetical protein
MPHKKRVLKMEFTGEWKLSDTVAAVNETRQLGINPKGKVKVFEHELENHSSILPDHFNRLLTEQECLDIGLFTKKKQASKSFVSNIPSGMMAVEDERCGHQYHVCEEVLDLSHVNLIPCPVCDSVYD